MNFWRVPADCVQPLERGLFEIGLSNLAGRDAENIQKLDIGMLLIKQRL